jgi:hypothetical protein
MSSKNLPVSISIFSTLDAIELVQFNEKSGDVEKLASLPCAFDPVTRQMADREQMTQTVRDLYNVNRLPFSTPAVLVLPSFFTREIDLPAEFSRDELRFALVSEAERFYVFKKTEPQIDWINLDKDRLLYSAFPKTEIDKYTSVFQELRIPLMAIELSYFSMIRGLLATGVLGNESILNPEPWCLVTISNNSMFASIQKGLKLQKTIEVPLSIMEDGDQTAISEIQQDFVTFSANESFQKLFFINNSRNINSQDVLMALGYSGEVVLIEQNGSTLRSRGAVDGVYPCSLEGIGGVFRSRFSELSGLNFLPETSEDIASISHYQKQAMKWLLMINAGMFVLSLVLWGLLTLIVWQKEQEAHMVVQQVQRLGNATTPGEMLNVERRQFSKKVVDRNVRINNFLVKAGTAIPKDAWLEKVDLTSDVPSQPWTVSMVGKALKLDSVNQMLNDVNSEADSMPVQVQSAAQATSADGQAYFTWTLQTANSQAQPGQPGAPTP